MAKSVPQKSDEPLHEQRDWLRVTLSSIGDAVITTDTEGRVTFLNPVAAALTGWPQADAAGKPLDDVFNNQETRRTVESQKDLRVKTANHSFYQTFQASPEETEGQFVYDLGNRQWDIPALNSRLGQVLLVSAANHAEAREFLQTQKYSFTICPWLVS